MFAPPECNILPRIANNANEYLPEFLPTTFSLKLKTGRSCLNRDARHEDVTV